MKEALERLYNFSQLLSQNNIKHWLDWGSLLHGYSDKELHDDDVDFGLLKQDWDKVKQVFNITEETPLETGVQKMADWAKKSGSRASSEFGNIEVEKNLPEGWRKK